MKWWASHELRTPLSAISWSLERLFENDKEYSTLQKKSLDQISRQTKNMLKLINDLLVATKMELGVYSYKYEEVNPLNIAENVIEGLTDEIKNKKINLKLNLDKFERIDFSMPSLPPEIQGELETIKRQFATNIAGLKNVINRLCR